jgi:ATP-dependent DNA ligase
MLLQGVPKKTFPISIPRMMAESTKAPFDSPDWIFEIKLDGYRAITVFDSDGKPHLWYNGELRHYGYAGSGFSEKGLKDTVEKMKPLFTEKCPFVNSPNIKEKIQRVRPKLVCEVEYAELTADDQLRRKSASIVLDRFPRVPSLPTLQDELHGL